MEIKPLSENVISKICSFCFIKSITHCVTELILNALDAKSSAIAIRINPNYFRIQIVDNGIGISQENMENIARKNFTSKCSSLDDLDHKTNTHGYKGESLWNISHVSKNVNITSKCSNSDKTFSRKISNGKRSKIVLTKNRQSNGTTVTVDGLFNNLPVRQKVIKKEYELEEIVTVMKSLSIIYPQVSFSLRNDLTGKLILKCQKHNNVIQSLISLYPEIKESDLTVMKVRKDKIKVDTLLLKEITYRQIIQQIFVNRRPTVFPDLHKLVCQLLQKGQKKNILNANFHPLFIINVKCPMSHYNLTYEDSSPVVEFKNIDILERCVKKMISNFLGKPLENNNILEQENKLKSVCGVSDLFGAIKGYGFKNWLREDEIQRDTKENEVQLLRGEECKENGFQQSDKFKNTENNKNAKRQKFKKPKPLPIKICELKNKRITMKNEMYEKTPIPSKSKNRALANIQNDSHDIYSLHSNISGNVLLETVDGTFIKNYQNLEEKFEKLILKKDMNASLFSNFTKCENKGKDVIMYMFLKSTELFSNNAYNEQSEQHSEQCVYDKLNNSNETIMESNIFFKNTRETKTHKMNKTVSISVKLKRRRNKFPEEKINIQSNTAFTCSKPKRRKEDELENNFYTKLKKNDKATSPFFNPRKRNFESTQYATNRREDKNIQTTFFEERSEAKSCPAHDIPRKIFKYYDGYGKDLDNNLYNIQSSKEQTEIKGESNAIFEDNIHMSNSFRFKFPNENDEIKFLSHLGRNGFQNPHSISFSSNNAELMKNENKLFSDWNKPLIFNFKESCNKSQQIRSNQKFPIDHNYEPYLFELKKLPDNSSSKKLNNAFHRYTDEYLNSIFKVNDVTLGKSFNFENLSVSSIPKLIPIPNRKEISAKTAFINETFAGTEIYGNVLPFKKCSTGNHVPNIYRNDGYENIEDQSNFQFRKAYIQPITNTRSLHMKNVKRNLDNLFFKSRFAVNQKEQNNTTKVKNREIFTKDSLEDISGYTSNENVCLWKKFIEGKTKQKNNLDGDVCEALAYSIKKQKRMEQTEPSEQIKLLSEEMLHVPFSPDLFSARIHNSKVDLTLQPNSQPSFEVCENSCHIEKDISLINRIFNEKENCPPTLTAICEKSPTSSVKQLVEGDILDIKKNYSLPANETNWDWIEKLDHQGNKFYFNIRTGMTNFIYPKHDEGFNFKPRFEFMPKGLSPVLMQDDKVSKTISPNCRMKLHDEILKSYENELDIVKWEKYFKENDPRKFFDELYKERRNDYEGEVPNLHQSNISRCMVAITDEYKYSKALFNDLEVIGQLDLKFITTIDRKHSNLIMFDQHAVHERIRLESLEKEYNGAYTPCENITLFVVQCDIKLLKHHEEYLNTIGIYFKTFKNGLTVYKVPLCLYNKAKKEQKQNSWNLAKLVEVLLQEIIKQIKMTRGILNGLPKTIHEIINLEACRGAIKFGDYLSEHEMKKHIKDLSQCLLPFQCAHGRPTLVPILNLPRTHTIQFKKLQFKKLKKSVASNSNQDLNNSLYRLDENTSKYFDI